MRSPSLWPLFVFLVIVSALFGVHYLFLKEHGFDSRFYILAFAMLLPASMIVGYIFIASIRQAGEDQKETLEHLVREVLHEINLPLSTIKANAEMIYSRSDDEKIRKRAQRIGAASVRLQKLYKELAYNIRKEYSRAEKESFDLKDLIVDRISCFEDMGRNIFKTELAPLRVYADRIGLEQVLDNILENAIKYSPTGGVVRIHLSGEELSVSDEGTGMDENEIVRIFERYYQGDRRVHGEGIGLSLVKRYCDDENVGLKIVSKKGEGTKVILNFSRILENG